MKQAKTLTAQELRRVLDHIATRKYAARNRAMLLLTHWAGMRVGEVAALKISDVLDDAGQVKSEIRLAAAQTKGHYARVVFINRKLQKELATYALNLDTRNRDYSFFPTQRERSRGFSANTLAQFFHALYKAAGIDGASSHSGRRSYLTLLSSKGVSVRVLMALAGHRNLATTIQYIDASDDMKRRAVELVG